MTDMYHWFKKLSLQLYTVSLLYLQGSGSEDWYPRLVESTDTEVYCKVLGTSVDTLASMRCGVVCPGVESPWIPRDGCINVVDFYLPRIPLCLRTILQYCYLSENKEACLYNWLLLSPLGILRYVAGWYIALVSALDPTKGLCFSPASLDVTKVFGNRIKIKYEQSQILPWKLRPES